MAARKSIAELKESAATRTPGGAVEYYYNRARDNFISGTWRILTDMAGGGFGKAVLATAAIIVGGTALALGMQAMIGAAGMATPIGIPTGEAATVLDGLLFGAQQGLAVLGHPVGWALMGIAGAAGIAISQKHEHTELEQAKARAAQRQLERALAKEKIAGLDPDLEKAAGHPLYDHDKDFSHVAKEMKRRAAKGQGGPAYA